MIITSSNEKTNKRISARLCCDVGVLSIMTVITDVHDWQKMTRRALVTVISVMPMFFYPIFPPVRIRYSHFKSSKSFKIGMPAPHSLVENPQEGEVVGWFLPPAKQNYLHRCYILVVYIWKLPLCTVGVPDPKSYESLKSQASTASHGSTGSKLSTASSQVSGRPRAVMPLLRVV
jgi:hypothetical protein